MKKLNLQEIFMDLGYTETSWKSQKTKHLKAIGFENASEMFYLDEEKWTDLKKQIGTVKAKQSAIIGLVKDNYLQEPKAQVTKVATAKNKAVEEYNSRQKTENQNTATKRLLDKIKELESEVVNLKAENTVMKIQLDWNEKA